MNILATEACADCPEWSKPTPPKVKPCGKRSGLLCGALPQ